MDNEQLEQCLNTVKQTWNIPALDGAFAAKVWVDSLRPYAQETAMEALTNWVKVSNFPPKISDIVSLCQEVEAAQKSQKARENSNQAFENLKREKVKEEPLPEDHEAAWRQHHLEFIHIGLNIAIVNWTQSRKVKSFPWDKLSAGYDKLSANYPLLRISCRDAKELMQRGKEAGSQQTVIPNMVAPQPKSDDGLPF